MPTITMPKLSDTMTEGTLVRWCKKQGDTIEIGDLLAEVETDKATMEMESFEEGILTELFVAEGAKVPVGSRIAMILGKNEKITEVSPAVTSATSKDSISSIATPPIFTLQGKSRTAIPGATSSSTTEVQRIKASPLARKIATSRGLELSSLTGKGTGPGGRVIAADVITAPLHLAARDGSSSPSAVAAIMPTTIVGNPETQIPLSNMRQIISQRLLASKTTIPHFYLSIEIDAAPMVAFRKEFMAAEQTKITFNDIVLLATARAAMEKPKVNAAFALDRIYQYESVNLCVAIAVEDGLVTPVLRDAQKMTLQQISANVKDFATRARDKKLKPDEFSGGTITVSNLGAYGIDQFYAIINPPQAVILAVGAITKKPIINANDEIAIGQRMTLTLSGDHRVVDGAVAAEYLAALKKLLESPARLLI
ncbi:MAG: dihydrolipoamide acetyltransferase family protein [Chthoniobacterales bacterium]